jgi:hypothetical protein
LERRNYRRNLKHKKLQTQDIEKKKEIQRKYSEKSRQIKKKSRKDDKGGRTITKMGGAF